MDITAKDFGKSHTNIGLSMHARVMYDWTFVSADFFSDLDVGVCIF